MIVQNGKYGFINHDGRVVIPPQFIWAMNFWHGLGDVYVCGRYASIDASGRLFPRRIAVEGQLIPWVQDGKFGFVDASGKFKIEPTFEFALPFSEGLAAVQVDNRWGYIDGAGNQVIQPKFGSASNFRDGVALAEFDSGGVLINISGEIIASGYDLPPYPYSISDGRVPATKGEKAGYLDTQGKVVIPFTYDEVRPFAHGLAPVEKDGKWGYIDRDGHVLVSLKFDEAGPFGSGLAAVKLENHAGFIDKTGNFLFYLPFDSAYGFSTDDSEGLGVADSDVSSFWTEDHRFGYVNTSGSVIWGPTVEIPAFERIGEWSDEEKARSCEGIPDAMKAKIAALPQR